MLQVVRSTVLLRLPRNNSPFEEDHDLLPAGAAYDYGALEPAITGEILEPHHDKHHAGHVKGANSLLDQLAEVRAPGEYDGLVGPEKSFAFDLAGHVLHTLFWNNISPDGGDRPDGELVEAIGRDVGSSDALRAQLTAPLLVFDAWEHAFYLQYKNVKTDYVERRWDIVNGEDVSGRFAAAMTA